MKGRLSGGLFHSVTVARGGWRYHVVQYNLNGLH
jgi:hypothetical protein